MAFPDVYSALFSKLSNDSGLTALVGQRIYSLQAPNGATYPLVIYYLASGVLPNDSPRDSISDVYRVDSWSTVSAAHARTVADAVHSALHEQALTIPGWSNYWLVATRVTDLVDTTSAKQYWRRVIDFNIRASKD